MATTYRNLEDFLRKHTTKERKFATHTRIPDKNLGIYGGAYHIKDSEYDEFLTLYSKEVLLGEKEEYLTEIQLKDGNSPILVDLDFRYDTSVTERQHGEDFGTDVAELYIEVLNKVLKITPNTEFPVWIMEKDNVVVTDKCTKDGIHLIIGIACDHKVQQLLRNEVMEQIGQLLDSLPLTNTKEDVLDASISTGNTGWQLYGSKKPGNIPYKITQFMKCKMLENGELDSVPVEFEYENNIDILKSICARNRSNVKFELSELSKEKIASIGDGKQKKRVKLKSIKKRRSKKNYAYCDFTNQEELEATIEEIMMNLDHEDYNLRETHNFVMALPAKFYNPYENWIKVGWALHNTDERLFPTWMLFSSQSEKFDYDDVDGYYETWEKMKEDGLTERSIMYWCKQDNPTQYKKIRDESVDYMIIESCKTRGESDFARVLYYLFKDRFRVFSEEKKEWMEYREHRWVPIGKGSNLRSKISGVLSNMYMKKADEAMLKSQSLDSGDDQEKQNEFRKLAATFTEIGKLLKTTRQKDNIMKEALEIFYIKDPKFSEQLNNDQYLMGFNNGILDIRNKEFRAGTVDDYVSMTTNIDYEVYDSNNSEHVKIMEELNNFMSTIFPIPNVKEYMYQHMASMLVGENKTQSFNIYNGSGSNGKSMLVDLLKKSLGEYATGSVPLSLITGDRPSTGGTNTELLHLKNKRLAVMNEPSKNMPLNTGAMKELTGGDEVQARGLYEKKSTHFTPQFKLVACTNTMFDINSNDDGTWRRIKRIDFISKFAKNAKPTAQNPHIYEMDTSLSSRLQRWAPLLMWKLAQIAFEKQGDVDVCKEVEQSSNEYRTEQDSLELFVSDMIMKEEEGKEVTTLKITSINQEFKRWFNENADGKPPKPREIRKFFEKKFGAYPRTGWKGIRFRADYDDEEDEEDEVGIYGDE